MNPGYLVDTSQASCPWSVTAFDFLFVTASGLKRLMNLEKFGALTALTFLQAAMAAAQG